MDQSHETRLEAVLNAKWAEEHRRGHRREQVTHGIGLALHGEFPMV